MDGSIVGRWVDGKKYLLKKDRLQVMPGDPGGFVIIVHHYLDGTFSQHVDVFEDKQMALEMLSLHREQGYLEDAVWSDQTERWEHLRPTPDAPRPKGLGNFFKRLRR